MKKGMKASEGAGSTERGRSSSGVAPATASNFDPSTVRRWSLHRKQEIALRMLRGEPLEALSRELGVDIYWLEEWKQKALAGMESALRERVGDPLNTELDQAKRRIGELSMENELLRMRIEKKLPFPTRRLK